MKILLLIPPEPGARDYADFDAVAPEMPSIGLAYVYSALEVAGHEVRFRDYQAERLPMESLIEDMQSGGYDLAGMQTYVTTIQRCISAASRIKESSPETKVVLGGAHATIFPEEVASEAPVDYVCIGEGEALLVELLEHLQGRRELSDIQGLCYRDGNGAVVKNPSRPHVEDLDSLPIPKYGMFNMSLYYPSAQMRGRVTLNMMTSRGCPYRCSFCASSKVWKCRIRFQSVERSISEIKMLKELHGADAITLYDDNFTVNRRRVKEFCRRMLEERLNLKWACFTRGDLLDDEEMVDIMKAAGCYLVILGIESGSRRVLSILQKDLDLDLVRRNVRMVAAKGIRVQSSFMLGTPTETLAEMEETIQYAKSIDITYAVFPIFTPFPGTPMYDFAMANGTLVDSDYSKFIIYSGGVYSSGDLSPKDYLKMQSRAFLQFYLRPKILFRMAVDLLSLPPGRMLRFILGGMSYFRKAARKALPG